jgi:hypothetical protein
MEANKISLELKAKYPSKEAWLKKIKIVEARVFQKTGYISALTDYFVNLEAQIKLTKDELHRSRCAVEYFETMDKINAQKAILSQHKMYLEELKKIEPDE